MNHKLTHLGVSGGQTVVCNGVANAFLFFYFILFFFSTTGKARRQPNFTILTTKILLPWNGSKLSSLVQRLPENPI